MLCEHMNASCIDCFASPVSSFSATASVYFSRPPQLSCGMRAEMAALARADPVRVSPPNSTRHLAVRDSTSPKRRNFRTDSWPHP